MTKIGLANILTQNTGRKWTEDEAQELLDLYEETYPDYTEFRNQILDWYREDGLIALPDGWKMFGDNDNFRSVANCPVQGFGGCVMRKAVDMCFENGLYVPWTLHDAIYIEGDIGEEIESLEILKACMIEAFAEYFEDSEKDIARKVKLDGFAWSKEYTEGEFILSDGWKCPYGPEYVDERATSDLEQFRRYFTGTAAELL